MHCQWHIKRVACWSAPPAWVMQNFLKLLQKFMRATKTGKFALARPMQHAPQEAIA